MMNTRKILAALAVALATEAGFLLGGLGAADEPAADSAVLVVVDANGKEQKLKAWKFTAGTRPLTWLAAAPTKDAKEKDDTKADAGKTKASAVPEALIFRDDNSTEFQNGILTLIPLDRLRSLEYDNEKRMATAHVKIGDKADADEVLTGTTKFIGNNRVTVAAEVDKGDLGIAEVKFLGGVDKGIQAIRFPSPKAAADAAPAGRPGSVTIADKENSNVQKAADLQVLYRFADGSEKLAPTLFFKKTLKLDVAKIQKLKTVEGASEDAKEHQVTLKDGTEETLTLLRTVTIDDKPATLVGLLGKVPAGYKLFPIHTIAEVVFEEMKEEKP